MPNRGENIYNRKDGRWEGRYKNGYKPNGKTRYTSVYGKTYSEVRRIISLKRIEASNGVGCNLKVKDIFKLWLRNIRVSVKESTYSNYYMKIHKHILPFLGQISYDKLTADFLNNFIEVKLSEGLSEKYVYDINVLIRAAFKYARKNYGYADKSEFMNMPKCKTDFRKKMLSETEFASLMSALKNNMTFTKLGILIAAFTGIRIGELCALKWSDIDFKNGVISIQNTVQRITNFDGQNSTKVVITSPKSQTSIRKIPVPQWLKRIMYTAKCAADSYILTGTTNYVEPRTMQYRFRSLLKKLNLPLINFHTLRHMFATRCISIGFDVKTLSEILGHSSVEITLNRYVHSSMERKRKCMQLLVNDF